MAGVTYSVHVQHCFGASLVVSPTPPIRQFGTTCAEFPRSFTPPAALMKRKGTVSDPQKMQGSRRRVGFK